MAAKKSPKLKPSAPYVVLRADSGVYVGERVSFTPNGDGRMTVILRQMRRIWNWAGFTGVQAVHTVEDIANYGVGPTSKVSATVAEGTIADARLAVTCTPKAREVLEAAKWAT